MVEVFPETQHAKKSMFVLQNKMTFTFP